MPGLSVFRCGLVAALVACASLGAARAQIVDPRDFFGLVLWTDANDVNGTGVQPSNGALVTQWADKSGGGFHLTGAAGVAPVFQATGFDSVNPAIRVASGKYLAGANPFGGLTATQPQTSITFFVVAANNAATANGAFSLNGDNAGSAPLGGRYSLHIRWRHNGRHYFDAGGCCVDHRVDGADPNGVTETTVYSALSNGVSGQQLLRIDGGAFASETPPNSADPAMVNQGVRLSMRAGGLLEFFDGRFGEIVVYNRALSMAEIQWVECYLLYKWKRTKMPAGCVPSLTATKSVASWNDGVNPVFNIPGNDVTYTLTVTRSAGIGIDSNSVFIVDRLPPELTFFNGDADGPGPGATPVLFSGAGTGLTFTYATDVRYASGTSAPSSFAGCTYTPTAGYDPNVRFICFNPKGVFSTSSPSSTFTLKFRTRIN